MNWFTQVGENIPKYLGLKTVQDSMTLVEILMAIMGIIIGIGFYLQWKENKIDFYRTLAGGLIPLKSCIIPFSVGIIYISVDIIYGTGSLFDYVVLLLAISGYILVWLWARYKLHKLQNHA